MTPETNTIPDDMAARVARLINEAEDMRQQAADDLKQIYADLREELRGLGWDGKHVSAEVAALKGAIGEMRLDEKAKEKREERGERIDDYVSLLTRARAREVNGYAAARRSDAGLNIVTKHEDIQVSPEAAKEHPHHLKTTRGDESGTLEGSVEDHGQVAGCKPESQTDGNETVTVVGDESGTVVNSEKATVATQGEATAPTSDDGETTGTYAGEDRAAANKGGHDAQQVQHVNRDHRRHFQDEENTSETSELAEQAGGEHEVATGNAERVPTNTTGEGSASALPIKTSIRPLCRNPGDACGGYGRKHCRACETAAAELEAAE